MTRIRQSDGASKGFPRTPVDEYGTHEQGGSRIASPVLNEAQMIQRNFKTTGTLPPATTYAEYAQERLERVKNIIVCRTPGGRVFTMGGFRSVWYNQAQGSSQKVSYYDPQSGLWTALNDYPVAMLRGVACAISDNEVLIGGGTVDGSTMLNTWYRYNLTTGSYVTLPTAHARAYPAAIKVADGRIIVFCGTNGSSNTTTVTAFNPDTNTWTTLAALAVGLYTPKAVLLPDGRVLISGGSTTSSDGIRHVIFNPTTNTSVQISGPTVTNSQFVHLIPRTDGKVYAIIAATGALHVYDPVAAAWTALTAPPVAITHDSGTYESAALGTNNDLIVCFPSGSTTTVRRYSASLDTWSTVYTQSGAYFQYRRPQHVSLPDGRILLIGGIEGSNTTLRSSPIFDPSTNTFDATTQPPVITDVMPSFSGKANGGQYSLYAETPWHPTGTYQWKKDGANISLSGMAPTNFTPVPADHGKNITVTVTTPGGAITSPNIPITIIPNDIGIDYASTELLSFYLSVASGNGADSAATDGVGVVWAIVYEASQYRAYRSTDNGSTFTLTWAPGAGVSLYGVAFGAGKFVFIGNGADGYKRIWSIDANGTTATQRWIASSAGGSLSHVFFDGTSFYATDYGYSRLTSSDGVTWAFAGASTYLTGAPWIYGMVKLGSGRYVVTDSNNKVWTTDDLDVWTLRYTATGTISSIALSPDGSRVIISRGSSDAARYSTDGGVTWNAYGENLGRLAVGGGKMFSCSVSVPPKVSVDNGVTWTAAVTNPLSNHFPFYTAGRVLALAISGAPNYVSP